MADRTWIGNAAKTTEVQNIALGGTWEADDVVIFTFANGKSLSVTTGSTVAATIATTLANAWNALTAANGYPEFAEITASTNSDNLILTMDTAGRPFTVTATTTEAGGGAADAQTLTPTTTTAATGPNHWDNAANWSGATLPVDGDNVYIDNSSVDILYGLAQSAIEPALLRITQRYTGKIGLPTLSPASASTTSTAYTEYRDQFLVIGPAILDVGTGGTGNGSPRLKIDCGTDQTVLNVYGTGTSVEPSLPTLQWKGTHASNVANIHGGSVGIAATPGEAATVATLRQTGGTCVVGAGATLTTISKAGGTLTTESNVTTYTSEDGITSHLAGTVTTLTVSGGTVNYDSTGTITTLTINNDGNANFDRKNQARTVTNCTVNDSGSIIDSFDTVTFTNPIAWKGMLRIKP